MVYINKKSTGEMQTAWENNNQTSADAVTQIFGWASHEKFYYELEMWCTFIDNLIPTGLSTLGLGDLLKGFLLNVVRSVYNHNAFFNYDRGADTGYKIMGKVNETINWAKNQITNEVNDAKAYIQANFIAPIQGDVTNLKNQINDAFNKLQNALNQIDGMNTNINAMQLSVGNMKMNILDFNIKIKNFNSTLDDAQNKLTQFKNLMDALDKRVTALEGKPQSKFPLFDTKEFMNKL